MSYRYNYVKHVFFVPYFSLSFRRLHASFPRKITHAIHVTTVTKRWASGQHNIMNYDIYIYRSTGNDDNNTILR